MATQVINGLEQLLAPPGGPAGCVVSIGNFDGVHRGHQRILGRAGELAEQGNLPVVAVTLQPAPVRLLAPDKAPRPLMHLDQRCHALGAAGAHIVLVLHTTPELLAMEANAFVCDVLVGRLAPRHVVEGPNFFFGHNRQGNVQVLTELGRRYGFQTHIVEPVRLGLGGDEPVLVSSSLIRNLVMVGRVEHASECLGRPYTMQGRVIHGDGRGRRLHYPTANLHCGEQLIPGDGVYAGRAWLEQSVHVAALSVGDRPTFPGHGRAVEAFLLDAEGDFYEKTMSVEFHRYLRQQERFATAEALCRQMDEDVKRVKEALR